MTPEERLKFSQRYARFGSPPQSLLGKVITFMLGGIFLVLAFMFSVVALAVVAVGGLALWGWIWWKTRALREQLREQMQDPMRPSMSDQPSRQPTRRGEVIEGEVIREADAGSEGPRPPRPLP